MATGGDRRPRGTGCIFQKHGNWYGQWHGLTRKLEPIREPGSRRALRVRWRRRACASGCQRP